MMELTKRHIRFLFFALVLLFSTRMYGVGWTPTSGGLVVNLQPEDKILISVEIGGKEYFLNNYGRYTGGEFNYEAGNYLKLLPQGTDSLKPSDMSIWTVDTALTRVSGKTDYALGGISYTIWNDDRTLRTDDSNDKYRFYGDLDKDIRNEKLCDVVFVIPTNYSTITSFDPNKTAGHADTDSKGRFNGLTGTGFLGMTYREVYMMVIPRFNSPISYTNAALVTFNTTKSNKNWSAGTIKPGRAAYAYRDNKHNATTRTVFRLYILNEPINSCGGYFFAYDEQNTLKYRQSNTMTDSTAKQKVYTMDRLFCMERIDDTQYYQTGLMNVPAPDSAYYYVGYNDDFRYGSASSEPLGSSTAASAFEPIRTLPMRDLDGFTAPANAYGRMVADTASPTDNLNVKFDPAGYFLKVSTGKNVRMRETSPGVWTSEEMWTILGAYENLTIKATLMTGPEFSEYDPGADIEGWTDTIKGKDVPVKDAPEGVENSIGQSGWARIYTDNTGKNGGMEFILADSTLRIRYDNNGFLGTRIPDQYPIRNQTTVVVEPNRLKTDYTFLGWSTTPAGPAEAKYNSGETIDLATELAGVKDVNGIKTLTLYAQASYSGTLQVALSFINQSDSKRYYLTHPNSSAPRFARARHFDDWTSTWQGMENAENLNPNYVSTFEVRCPVAEVKKKDAGVTENLKLQEHVLDPRRYTMKGYEDSLTFYEFFSPAKDEYLGLYYSTPNTIIANNTWAGLFTTTSEATRISWPDYRTPAITGVRLKSTRYVEEYDPENKHDSLMLKERANKDKPWVQYDPATNQFNGIADSASATVFDVSAVIVADAHYVVIPDTSEVWRDTITFDYHQNEQTTEQVWSKLIGKQLLAAMMVGSDTTFFHPNRDKIYTTPQELYLSSDFRLSQEFQFIRDARVSEVADSDRVSVEETADYWGYNLVSGENSPIINHKFGDKYIDIEDTFRISLSHGSISKIKEYRGRWQRGAKGLTVSKNGASRYRNVIIRTKTYHYGDTTTHLALTPEFDTYSLGPLVGQTTDINFTLTNVTTHWVKDAKGNRIREEIIGTPDTITDQLTLLIGKKDTCYLRNDTDMVISAATANRLTLTVIDENTSGINYDTLIITKIKVNGVDRPIDVRIPLTQAALVGSELVWSVVDESTGLRYFMVAGQNGLQFRRFSENKSMLYKISTTTQLRKGSKDANNTDKGYITPWTFAYPVPEDKMQITLKTEDPVDRFFIINGSNKGAVGANNEQSTTLTYKYVTTYSNSNANYEEQIKLQYATNGWLKFTGGATPEISLVADEKDATVFSWGYMQKEYSLLNNGTYPSVDSAQFGYNTTASTSIQTRYKAYNEYTMLLNNKMTYLCRSEETNLTNLTDGDKEWKTSYTVTRVADARTFDSGASTTASGLGLSTNSENLVTTITPGSATSPTDVKIDGKYVNIVDTMVVTLSAPRTYRFKGDWSSYTSISDANLKLPLIRTTYHDVDYDSLVCVVVSRGKNTYSYAFPSTLTASDSLHTFILSTEHRKGTHVVDVENNVVDVKTPIVAFVNKNGATKLMNLNDKTLAEVRLVDEFGNTPAWCKIHAKGDSTLTVKCLSSGVRAPRSAYLYLAYVINVPNDPEDPSKGSTMRFVNVKLTVSQTSLFESSTNQVLDHSSGASGDAPAANGLQQVHENRRILYYYPDEDVELPVRERAFYGWWRWYRESQDPNKVEADIPNTDWRQQPRNTGKYNYPFRTISGDTVWNNEEDHSQGVKYVRTMGRYTVFHYPSKQYNDRLDPPAKNPRIAPPSTTFDRPYRTDTIIVDISNYYDKLPMSVSNKNQVDTAMLDTMRHIPEPTLSLREIFELRPWTDMADILENYKDTIASGYRNLRYLEDHEMMAPIGNNLLLSTEQRYNLENLTNKGFSDSQLGYFMHDDNWDKAEPEWDQERKDSMIYVGGWDAECEWYIYHPSTKTYTPCTYSLTEENDFLKVPAKASISAGHEFDTVYYCLRAHSLKTLTAGTVEDPDTIPEKGDYWFNICRYKIIYHNPSKYGPVLETTNKGVTKAIITNEDIEQKYEVLERLNFDYLKPGKAYHIYPHPLPWADASYGYCYPETPDLPHNRFHDQSDFPNFGEYGLINRIPYSAFWHQMEQHGGAENGYMIYCDGMASAGQVAALSLETQLCEGQKMFFSGYVCNPSTQSGKANPNFVFSVQGSNDGDTWDDITSYMTGDIKPSNRWSQICFPILQEDEYDRFRVRIYNLSSSFDGNDFIIDDMCIFATKPPLIAYQASTACVDHDNNDSITHVIVRVDYKGITGEGLNGVPVYYTIQSAKGTDTTFISPIDKYFNQDTLKAPDRSSKPDTIYGFINMPAKEYEPEDLDSVFANVSDLLARFDTTLERHRADPTKWFRSGYVLESLEGVVRPVLYFVHAAKMATDIKYKVRMSNSRNQLMHSKCAMTSDLKVSNRMLLEINGQEKPTMEVTGMCANATYNIGLRIKSSMYVDSVAPIDVNGSCINDWLLYGDTVPAGSKARYGYYYEDIVTMVTQILRYEGDVSVGTNQNQFAASLAAVSRAEMERIQREKSVTFKREPSADAYDMLAHLVNKGFLSLYERNKTVTVRAKDSVEYIILPIIGTGSASVAQANMEVCPYPLFIKLKPDEDVTTIPLIIGGLHRDPTEAAQPVTVLVSEGMANDRITVKIDSIQASTAIHSIVIHSTNDPDFREGVHSLTLVPDKTWKLDGGSNDGYYQKDSTLVLRPASATTYHMKAGYNYTFVINMMTTAGALTDGDCRIGEIPFILGVVPNYMRWDPKGKEDNKWTNADNWIGVNEHNEPIHNEARYAPMDYTYVLIPEMTDGLPYPVVPAIPTEWEDSIQKVNFQYNICNVIRFMPGAAIGQQQRMEYTDAVIDMSMPYEKWALRSAPVKGMISGDLYMSNEDLADETPLWEVGSFDASGRTWKTGNGSFWLSVFSRETVHKVKEGEDENRTAAAEWSKVTNGMTLPLPPGQGWAVFGKTAAGNDAVVRLPKNDDIYYYYGTYGERLDEYKESGLQALRNSAELGNGAAGKLAFHPDGASQDYTITNDEDGNGSAVSTTSFVFGNPTMGYIDIWGFIADNTDITTAQIGYVNASGIYTTVTKSAVDETTDTITNLERYLPPMHAIVVTTASRTSLALTLNANRIVTAANQIDRPLAAPQRTNAAGRRKGIMTVTAINPVSERCTSRLLLGQGYHNAVLEGEDAILTTLNIDKFSMTNTPTTPFNIYAVEDSCGLSIDLLDSIVNVPISFYMSSLPYTPETQLWFTGVNAIDGPLVLYDALLGTERTIKDGICLTIDTPEQDHQKRYYIRRRGYNPDETGNPGNTTTGFGQTNTNDGQAYKIMHNGIIYIIRNGHVFTVTGQQVR